MVQSCANADGGWSGLLKVFGASEPGQIFIAGVVLHIYCSQDSVTKPSHISKVPQTIQVQHTSLLLLRLRGQCPSWVLRVSGVTLNVTWQGRLVKGGLHAAFAKLKELHPDCFKSKWELRMKVRAF